MRLLIEQHIFTFGDRFTVFDENGNDKYYVEGEIFSWGKKLHVTDLEGNELLYVEQRLFTFLPKYDIYIGGEQVMTVVREFSFFGPSYSVEGTDLSVEGDFFAHEYAIKDGDSTVASISKEWFSFGDCYVLDIFGDTAELYALAIVLSIDCVKDNNNN